MLNFYSNMPYSVLMTSHLTLKSDHYLLATDLHVGLASNTSPSHGKLVYQIIFKFFSATESTDRTRFMTDRTSRNLRNRQNLSKAQTYLQNSRRNFVIK